MTINGAAQNTGTIVIFKSTDIYAPTITSPAPNAAILSANSYTQTAGLIEDDSLLTAPTIDISGGSLAGIGTVQGTVNIEGGSAEAFSTYQTGAAGTLTVNGAYNELSGTLVADLYSAAGTPTSSLVAVSGPVNLQGGTLDGL